MREEYDFSNSMPNPYIKNLKKQITIRLEKMLLFTLKVCLMTLESPIKA